MNDTPLPLALSDAADFAARLNSAFSTSSTESNRSMGEESLRCRVAINNPYGLHMRPISAFVQAATRFQSRIFLWYDGRKADGRSQLDLMLLAVLPNSEVELEVQGPDASEAIQLLAGVLAAPEPDNPEPESLSPTA